MERQKSSDVGFLVLVNPTLWYERFRDFEMPVGVSYLVFQLETCAETGALCVRGYAQCRVKKKMSVWRKRLCIEAPPSVLKARPGAAAKIAQSCMTAGFDVDGKFWEVVRPHIVKGQLQTTRLERICLDIEQGVPLSAIATSYPKQWKRYGKTFQYYERVALGTEGPRPDWKRGFQTGMEAPMFTALQHYEFKAEQQRQLDEAERQQREFVDNFIKSI